MEKNVELNEGEIKISFSEPVPGKVMLTELGLEDNDLILESGLLRMVFDLEKIGEHHYYKVPTIEIAYQEEMGETHWQCDFNEETIVDKYDHHGKSTVILLNRSKLSKLEHHHKNRIVLHAEFPKPVHIVASESYINFFN